MSLSDNTTCEDPGVFGCGTCWACVEILEVLEADDAFDEYEDYLDELEEAAAYGEAPDFREEE